MNATDSLIPDILENTEVIRWQNMINDFEGQETNIFFPVDLLREPNTWLLVL